MSIARRRGDRSLLVAEHRPVTRRPPASPMHIAGSLGVEHRATITWWVWRTCMDELVNVASRIARGRQVTAVDRPRVGAADVVPLVGEASASEQLVCATSIVVKSAVASVTTSVRCRSRVATVSPRAGRGGPRRTGGWSPAADTGFRAARARGGPATWRPVSLSARRHRWPRSGRTRTPVRPMTAPSRRRTPTAGRGRFVRARSAMRRTRTPRRAGWVTVDPAPSPPRRRRKRSCSRSCSSSGPIVPIRAAASSIASGIPSSRAQIARTTSRSPSSRNAASAAPARSTNSVAAVVAGSSESTFTTRSVAMPIGSRLVASTMTAGQAPTIASTNSATPPTTCSQLSRTRSSSRS